MPRSPRAVGMTVFYDTLRQKRSCPTGGQGRPPLQDVLRLRRTSCNFAIAFCRVDVGIDPYGDFALLPFVVRFCGCNLRGRGLPRPYVTAKPALSPFFARSSYYNISGRDVL